MHFANIKLKTMTANELRIGNWIQVAGLSDGIGAFQIHYVHFPEIKKQGSHFEGIEITRELIEKCGFIEDDKDKGHFCIPLLQEKTWLEVTIYEKTHYPILYSVWAKNGGDFCCVLIPHIKYLHELQNLYFALTGKELEYTCG